MIHRKSADSFGEVTSEAWRQAAEASLKGGSLDRLRHRTDDDFELEVAYFPGDGEPTAPAARRGTDARAWDIRSRLGGSDLDRGSVESVNRRALEELEGGANSLELILDELPIESAADLNEALSGVYLDLAPVTLEPGRDFQRSVEWLCEVWTRREHDPASIRGAWNIDPFELAVSGRLGARGLDQAEELLQRASAVAGVAVAAWPQVTALRASARSLHLAGCSDAQEIACVAAAVIEAVRAMEQAGIGIAAAFGQVSAELALDADVFAGVAKLRAMRWVWARLVEACAVEREAPLVLQAVAAPRMMAARETMTNVLRVTCAATAAALGGADVLVTLPFDVRQRLGSESARAGHASRLARNTQVILQEESRLHEVQDVAGGSWYLERRTRALVERAWEEFQAIEAAGGLIADLRGGRLAEAVSARAAERSRRIRRRQQVLVGVSDFAQLAREPTGLGGTVEKQAAGAFARRTLDHEFEGFRQRSDRRVSAGGQRPQVWLANLGQLKDHNPRTNFVTGLLAAGGIEAVSAPGAQDAESLADAYRTSERLPIAVLCSSDALYAEHATACGEALRDAGAQVLYYAGSPGEHAAELEAAGFSGFLRLGMDAIGLYQDLYAVFERGPDSSLRAAGQGTAS